MIQINPQQIFGNWDSGYALDVHTVQSIFLGYDEFGHPKYDNKRSEIGEALYKIKYQSDKSSLPEVFEVVSDVLENRWKVIGVVDNIIPVPPSNMNRPIQVPVEIAKNLSEKFGKPIDSDLIVKVKRTDELKSVFNFEARAKILGDAFQASKNLNGKSILLIDDLYRSGATLKAIVESAKQEGAKKVYVLTLTKSRVLT